MTAGLFRVQLVKGCNIISALHLMTPGYERFDLTADPTELQLQGRIRRAKVHRGAPHTPQLSLVITGYKLYFYNNVEGVARR